MAISQMNEKNLTEQVDEIFDWALSYTATFPALTNFHQQLAEGRARLQEPMQVAIIGRIKAGKSTAMNALLGHALVPTGKEEVTFNVTSFQWGEQPSLQVHFKGKPTETHPFEAIADYTRRTDARMAELLSVDYLDAYFPHPLLKHFNLVDTPGLASFYKDDAANTQRCIGLTENEAKSADAILYLFDKSIAETEQKVVEEFTGTTMGQITPLKSIGVLTQVDNYWPSEANPMQAAKRVINRLQELPSVRRTLFSIVPLCGLMALGAQIISDDEFQTLKCLAALPEERVQQLLKTATRFITKTDDDLPSVESRQQLLQRLDRFGILLACNKIRTGLTERKQLTEALLIDAGLVDLRQIILSHFGNRAYLIKLDSVLRNTMALELNIKSGLASEEQNVLAEVIARLEALMVEQHALKELEIMRQYYVGSLDFDQQEVEMMLSVSGEQGTSCAQRLGMNDGKPEQLLAKAETCIRYWQEVAVDGGCDAATAQAAGVLTRSYERIAYHLLEAISHQEAAQRHLNFIL